MERTFRETLAALRREKNISQRAAAADLNISQALLSHYENGAREPGLNFVCRVCDYYGVTADYLLCRADDPDGAKRALGDAKSCLREIYALAARAEKAVEELEAKEQNG